MWSFLLDREPNDHELCYDSKLRRVKIRSESLSPERPPSKRELSRWDNSLCQEHRREETIRLHALPCVLTCYLSEAIVIQIPLYVMYW